MSDLEATLTRLEAATEGSRELDCDIFHALDLCRKQSDGTCEDYLAACYTTSIDAALTLVPEGWWVNLRMCRNINATDYYHCTLECSCDSLDRDMSDDEPDKIEVENRPSASIALCIAALKARVAHPLT